MQATARTRKGLRHLWAYFFILPNLAFSFVFFLYPVAETFRLSFFSAGLAGESFIGLDNYRNLLQDETFLRSVRNTFYFVLLIVPATVVVSFTLAGILYTLRSSAKSLFRALLYLPDVCTPIVLTMVWAWIYNTNFGLLNHVTESLGLGRHEWLGSPATAIVALCVVVVTWAIGQPIILYLSSMDGVSREIYEAADIDGASPFRKFVSLTLPLISHTSLFVIITTTIGVFQIFVVIQLLTGGGPFFSTETLVFTIYRTAFRSIEFGLASAQSVVLFAIVMIIALTQLKLFKAGTD